ncbi:MAG TPA: sugar ABC transporter ATP-binding protein [Acetobacteraceae bacterium]|nr:sugar ABC transporter ATP-binding protein [Acetobacteraceae bacterium]
MSAMLLRMRGIEKRFGGVHALRGVDFDLRAGEVHALLGENGAGKSTLMGILSGAVAPDRGEVAIDGMAVRFASPREAQAAGIAMIPQELDLIPGLDIAANLFLGHETLTALGMLDSRSMLRAARERLRAAGVALDAARPVAELRIGERQLVAIAKALSAAARILVMDEPTAALSAAEAAHLFGVVRELSGRGVGVIYISHRLEEVAHVADRVTVLRDGAVVGETRADAPQAELVRLLVGRRFEDLFPPRAHAVGDELLRLDHARFIPRATRAGWRAPRDVSLSVRAGEIVGLAGLMGAGRTELLSALYGAGPRGRWAGQVFISGRPAQLGSIGAARRAGLAFVTDDRRGSGLVLGQSVGWNVVMSTLRRLTPFGLVSRPAEAAAVDRAIGAFDIRPRRADVAVRTLSGGNQQKVVFAKELLTEPRLLLLDEPTRGVDVGAKSEIYHRLRALAGQGLGVLVASSELPELIGLCDRIVVLRGGASVAEFAGGVDEAELQAASAGEVEAA